MRTETEIAAKIKSLKGQGKNRGALIAASVLEERMDENDITKMGNWSSDEGEFAQKVREWMELGHPFPTLIDY